jgi:exodeoxyribonuclease VII small subunit
MHHLDRARDLEGAAPMHLEEVARGEDEKGTEALPGRERGAQLKRRCEGLLADAQRRVDRIVKSAEGTVTTEPVQL